MASSYFFRSFRHPYMNMQNTGQTIAAPLPLLSPTESYRMSTPTARTVSTPRWMLRTGWLLSFLVVAQLLSSAWFRATQHTYAVAEIVDGLWLSRIGHRPHCHCGMRPGGALPCPANLCHCRNSDDRLSRRRGGHSFAGRRHGACRNSVRRLNSRLGRLGNLLDSRICELVSFRRSA